MRMEPFVFVLLLLLLLLFFFLVLLLYYPSVGRFPPPTRCTSLTHVTNHGSGLIVID